MKHFTLFSIVAFVSCLGGCELVEPAAHAVPDYRPTISVAAGYCLVTENPVRAVSKQELTPNADDESTGVYPGSVAGEYSLEEEKVLPEKIEVEKPVAKSEPPKGEWVLVHRYINGQNRSKNEFVPYNKDGELEVHHDPKSLYKWVRRNGKWAQVLKNQIGEPRTVQPGTAQPKAMRRICGPGGCY